MSEDDTKFIKNSRLEELGFIKKKMDFSRFLPVKLLSCSQNSTEASFHVN